MTDSAALRDLIASRGLKYQYIAKCLNISRETLDRKIKNKSDFRTGEVQLLCEMLGITEPADKERYFFAQV